MPLHQNPPLRKYIGAASTRPEEEFVNVNIRRTSSIEAVSAENLKVEFPSRVIGLTDEFAELTNKWWKAKATPYPGIRIINEQETRKALDEGSKQKLLKK